MAEPKIQQIDGAIKTLSTGFEEEY